MTLSFTKTFETNYFLSDDIMAENVSIYTLLDDNKEIGVLIISSKLSIIKFQQQKWFIRKGQISKQEDIESLIGHFEVSDWSIFKGNSFKLYLIGKEYQLKKVKPDQKYSIFKKETWGQFKLHLDRREEKIIYSFNITTLVISVGNHGFPTPFNGKIESKHSEILTVLAGLYLVEKLLDNEMVP